MNKYFKLFIIIVLFVFIFNNMFSIDLFSVDHSNNMFYSKNTLAVSSQLNNGFKSKFKKYCLWVFSKKNLKAGFVFATAVGGFVLANLFAKGYFTTEVEVSMESLEVKNIGTEAEVPIESLGVKNIDRDDLLEVFGALDYQELIDYNDEGLNLPDWDFESCNGFRVQDIPVEPSVVFDKQNRVLTFREGYPMMNARGILPSGREVVLLGDKHGNPGLLKIRDMLAEEAARYGTFAFQVEGLILNGISNKDISKYELTNKGLLFGVEDAFNFAYVLLLKRSYTLNNTFDELTSFLLDQIRYNLVFRKYWLDLDISSEDGDAYIVYNSLNNIVKEQISNFDVETFELDQVIVDRALSNINNTWIIYKKLFNIMEKEAKQRGVNVGLVRDCFEAQEIHRSFDDLSKLVSNEEFKDKIVHYIHKYSFLRDCFNVMNVSSDIIVLHQRIKEFVDNECIGKFHDIFDDRQWQIFIQDLYDTFYEKEVLILEKYDKEIHTIYFIKGKTEIFSRNIKILDSILHPNIDIIVFIGNTHVHESQGMLGMADLLGLSLCPGEFSIQFLDGISLLNKRKLREMRDSINNELALIMDSAA
jgi:hypothetical protein